MGTRSDSQPWEMVSVDLVGPMSRSKQGNVYAVVAQDLFTMWVEIRPLERATADPVAKMMKEQIILRFGCLKGIISDNGAQFTSRAFTSMLDEYGIDHQRTPPYSSQCNPVERMNRVVKTMFAQYVDQDHRTWDRYLPEFTFAINTAKHESTQCTPAFPNFGRELDQPKFLKRTLETEEVEIPHQKAERITRLHEVRELVALNLAKAFTDLSRYYDQRHR